MKLAIKPHKLNPHKPSHKNDWDLWESIEFSPEMENALKAQGWIVLEDAQVISYLSGKKADAEMTVLNLIQQNDQRTWGESFAETIIDQVGARNLLLAQKGTTPNITSLLQNLLSVKELLKTGALKTAISVINQVKPYYPAYEDIFSLAVSDITTFLKSKGYW